MWVLGKGLKLRNSSTQPLRPYFLYSRMSVFILLPTDNFPKVGTKRENVLDKTSNFPPSMKESRYWYSMELEPILDAISLWNWRWSRLWDLEQDLAQGSHPPNLTLTWVVTFSICPLLCLTFSYGWTFRVNFEENFSHSFIWARWRRNKRRPTRSSPRPPLAVTMRTRYKPQDLLLIQKFVGRQDRGQ